MFQQTNSQTEEDGLFHGEEAQQPASAATTVTPQKLPKRALAKKEAEKRARETTPPTMQQNRNNNTSSGSSSSSAFSPFEQVDEPPKQRRKTNPNPQQQQQPFSAATTNSHSSSSSIPFSPASSSSSSSGVAVNPIEALMGTNTSIYEESFLRYFVDTIYQNLSSPNIEIEGKLGVIFDRNTTKRLNLPIETDAVLRKNVHGLKTQFMSSLDHHTFSFLNNQLNARVSHMAALRNSGYKGPIIDYKKTSETDRIVRFGDGRYRLSLDTKTLTPVKAITKTKIVDVDVVCPYSTFDIRISVNEELDASLEQLLSAKPESEREKERVSYKYGKFWQIDITYVKNYSIDTKSGKRTEKLQHGFDARSWEVEVECNGAALYEEKLLLDQKKPNQFHSTIATFMSLMRSLTQSVTAFHESQQTAAQFQRAAQFANETK